MQFHINFYIAKYMKLQYKELKTQTQSCIQKTCTKISITNIELHTITHHFIQQKILHKHTNLHKQMQFHTNFYIPKYIKLIYKHKHKHIELHTKTYHFIQQIKKTFNLTNIELHTKNMYRDLNHKHRVTYNNTSFHPTKKST